MILKHLLNTQMIWVIFMKNREYNPSKKRKVLIIFDDMFSNKKRNWIVTESSQVES